MKIKWFTPIITRAAAKTKYTHEELEVGIVPAFFNFFQGRATFFAIVYGVIGVAFAAAALWGFLHGKDLSGIASVLLALATFLGALQAMLFAHSCKEDWIELQHRKLDIQEAAQPNNTDSPAVQ
jgi:hypothetical protein